MKQVAKIAANSNSNSIINTGAIVEHDWRIGAHVHIARGVVLSGGVEVGDHVHIGTGAIVIQGIKIGAGSVVVASNQIVYPAGSHTQAISSVEK
ncbi:MAG: hypothetical protein HOP02_15830 [Methylococcaceae bacterium]|nr:hypothetical protein [Methylococcaceae bacterium]